MAEAPFILYIRWIPWTKDAALAVKHGAWEQRMKHYKLARWPELEAPFHRTVYRRMLHQMSQRYVSVQQLVHESGLSRAAVVQFIDTLAERKLLTECEQAEPPSGFGSLRPVAWFRRTFSGAPENV